MSTAPTVMRSVWLPYETHAWLRAMAFRDGVTQSDIAVAAITDALAMHAKNNTTPQPAPASNNGSSTLRSIYLPSDLDDALRALRTSDNAPVPAFIRQLIAEGREIFRQRGDLTIAEQMNQRAAKPVTVKEVKPRVVKTKPAHVKQEPAAQTQATATKEAQTLHVPKFNFGKPKN